MSATAVATDAATDVAVDTATDGHGHSPIALPPGPAPAPRRQVLVGTVAACAAIATFIGGLSALWMKMRDRALDSGLAWLPKDVTVPEVPANVMLIAFIPACVFAQWAVYSAKRADRAHAGLALGLTAVIGIAIINAQAFIYSEMQVTAAGGAYHSMFYAVTGAFILLTILGVGFSVVAAFRYLAGRSTQHEIVSANAFYWYFLAAVFAVVWFVVYVTK